MENHILLRNSLLLQSIPYENITNYVNQKQFKMVNYAKNNIIHFANDKCNNLEIILSGTAVVERIDESGNVMIIADFIKDDILGGNLLFSKNPYYPMIITAREQTTIVEINKDTLLELLSINHTFLEKYLGYISDNAFILSNKIKHYVNRTLRCCIINYLNHECKVQKNKTIILNITKKRLAEMMGVQRTSLSRELDKMRKDNLIDYNKDKIIIKFEMKE